MDSKQPSTSNHAPEPADVVRWRDSDQAALGTLLARLGLELEEVESRAPIPGSYWGPPEAGLIGRRLYLRADTPVHSLLHEASHWVCMDPARRTALHTDAGGDYAEEDAVCYLQILLAAEIPDLGRERMTSDMDRWGYTFRLGSAGAWLAEDADDARRWLLDQGIIAPDGSPTWTVRRS